MVGPGVGREGGRLRGSQGRQTSLEGLVRILRVLPFLLVFEVGLEVTRLALHVGARVRDCVVAGLEEAEQGVVRFFEEARLLPGHATTSSEVNSFACCMTSTIAPSCLPGG